MVWVLLSQIGKVRMIVSIKINNLVQVRKKVTAKNVLARVWKFDGLRGETVSLLRRRRIQLMK